MVKSAPGYKRKAGTRVAIPIAKYNPSSLINIWLHWAGLPFVELIFETIVKIRQQGVTILLIEQNATAALEVADRAYVLESGKVKISGSAKELSADDKVTKAYLGH